MLQMYGSRNTGTGGGGGSSGFSNPGPLPATSTATGASTAQGMSSYGSTQTAIRSTQPGYNNSVQRGHSPRRQERMYHHASSNYTSGRSEREPRQREPRNALSTPASARESPITHGTSAARRSRSGANSPLMYRNQHEPLETYPGIRYNADQQQQSYFSDSAAMGHLQNLNKQQPRASSPRRQLYRARSLTRDESIDRDLAQRAQRNNMRDRSLDREYFNYQMANQNSYATYDPRREARARLRTDQELQLRNHLDNQQTNHLYDDSDPYQITIPNSYQNSIPHNSFSHNSLYNQQSVARTNYLQGNTMQEANYVNSLSMNNMGVNPASLRTMPQMVTTVLPAPVVTTQTVPTSSATTAATPGIDPLLTLKTQLLDLHKINQSLRQDLELTSQKLQSSMSSIKTFWSPELKKERALRKEEIAKFALVQEQLRLANLENQVSWSTNTSPTYRKYTTQ